MTNQDLENIRAVAPEWAKWLCVSLGHGWWQYERGAGCSWDIQGSGVPYSDNFDRFNWGPFGADSGIFAIDLKTGAIHVQHAGKIVVVSLAEWSAE